MDPRTIPALFTLTVLYVSYLSIRYLNRRVFIRKHGCQPPPSLLQQDPFFGLDLVLGFLRSLKDHRHNISLQDHFKVYGHTFTSKPYGKTKIFTCEPQNVQAIFSKDFSSWGVQPMRLFAFEPFAGRGIMNTDGALWEKSRAILRPAFARAQIADLSDFDLHVRQVIEMIPKDGSTVDLQPLFARLALDSATEFLFGESVRSLTPSSTTVDAKTFLAAYNYVQAGIGKRMQLPHWNLLTQDPSFWKSCRFARRFVDAYVERILSPGDIPRKEKPRRYILAYELAKETKDKDELRNQLLNIFLPAREAIGVFLTNVFFHLARNPAIWKSLRQELSEQGLLDASIGEVTSERLKGLKHLQHVMNETFRLNPSIGVISRAALCNTTLPVGGGLSHDCPVFVRKGDTVSISLYALHRRPDIFGGDADKYRPERWNTLHHRPWSYLPFGGGPRFCLGQQMALAQVSYTIVTFLQKFSSIENRDPVQEFVEVYKLSTESKHGAKVAFEMA